MTRGLVWLPSLLLLAACSTAAPKSGAAPTQSYQIINLGPEFERFWEAAKDKPFENQLHIWNREVEAAHQGFYDEMVWQKSSNPKWEERKLRRLKAMFGKYPTMSSKISREFKEFDSTLKKQVTKFSNFFSDAQFDLPIYAAPTTTFNGKGGEGGDAGDKSGKTVLAFGIDMIVDLNNDPDVLYSHELFHIYHTVTIGLNEQVFLKEGRLTLPLWLEGLATYVSEQMNPKAGLDAILMDKDLPTVSGKDIRELAKMFLSESNELSFDSKKPEIYKKWFGADPQFKLNGHYPMRSGYLLGLRVVDNLAKMHSLQEMVHWRIPDIHSHVMATLRELAI